MKVITEQYIRMAILKGTLKRGDKVVANTTTLITPSAVSFMREHGILISNVPETEVEGNGYQPMNQSTMTSLDIVKIQVSDQLMDILHQLNQLNQLSIHQNKKYIDKCWTIINDALNYIYEDSNIDANQMDIEVSEQMLSTLMDKEINISAPEVGDFQLIHFYQVFLKSLCVYHLIIKNMNSDVLIKNIFKLIFLTSEQISILKSEVM